MKIKKSLIKKVGERIGLKSKREIFAYLNFSENADMDDGLIMFGNVKNDFWQEAQRNLIIKKYGKKIYDLFKGPVMNYNKRNEISKAINPILKRYSEMAYNHFLNLFISKGLIHETHFARLNRETKYPSLSSYNYLNDLEIYTLFRRIGEERWSGRHPNPITKEVIDYHKKFNYEFKV
ncbi:hypothetical protein CO037_02880 [Candidatus Pacearchaeota archaeon CG_4_9_14_0_2_um_filter_30_8]|nr:MAG: hypothetical protein CO037_02880 [Candidatus Pacearchaeota archaeon CG_4_9_14_0_2_um_filter_30_8]